MNALPTELLFAILNPSAWFPEFPTLLNCSIGLRALWRPYLESLGAKTTSSRRLTYQLLVINCQTNIDRLIDLMRGANCEVGELPMPVHNYEILSRFALLIVDDLWRSSRTPQFINDTLTCIVYMLTINAQPNEEPIQKALINHQYANLDEIIYIINNRSSGTMQLCNIGYNYNCSYPIYTDMMKVVVDSVNKVYELCDNNTRIIAYKTDQPDICDYCFETNCPHNGGKLMPPENYITTIVTC
jgi:hypothetical protein